MLFRSLRSPSIAETLDEVANVGLRSLLAQVQSGVDPADALAEAPPRLRAGLEAAHGLLPRDPEQFPEAYQALARRLKLSRVKERLDHIARATAQVVGAHELDEETKRLQEERGELLRLKRQLEAPPAQGSTSTLPNPDEPFVTARGPV